MCNACMVNVNNLGYVWEENYKGKGKKIGKKKVKANEK